MKTKTFKIILVLIISGYTGITRAQNNGTLLSGAGTNSLTPSTGSGSTNCFIGSGAGKLNSGGSDNVAVGDSALYSQSYGPGGSWYSYNVAIGNQALFSNLSTATTNGIQNIGIGVKALRENTTGNRNSVLGFEAMKLNTKASQNVAIGYQALYTQGTYATSATTYMLR